MLEKVSSKSQIYIYIYWFDCIAIWPRTLENMITTNGTLYTNRKIIYLYNLLSVSIDPLVAINKRSRVGRSRHFVTAPWGSFHILLSQPKFTWRVNNMKKHSSADDKSKNAGHSSKTLARASYHEIIWRF